jgi:hypothetical protein
MAQIKEIYIHEYTNLEPPSYRLFALVRLIRFTDKRDEVLNLLVIESFSSDMLLSLPIISPKKLYIINISNIDEYLVLVN